MKQFFSKNLFVLISLSFLMVSSCGEKNTRFVINRDITFTVPLGQGINVRNSFRFPISDFGLEAAATQNDVTVDDVIDGFLESIALEVVSPFNADFRFLGQVDVFLEGGNLPEVLAASFNPVPPNAGAFLNITTTGNPVDAFLKLDEFTLRIDFIQDAFTAQEIEVIAYTSFQVIASQ